MKKLVEGLPFYRDKLHEEGVYARFQEILVKVKKKTFSSPTIKQNQNQSYVFFFLYIGTIEQGGE